MEISLKNYLPQELGTIVLGKNAVSIRADGVFSLTASLTSELELKAGTEILFSNDENAPKNWYLSFQPGFPLRANCRKRNTSVCFTSKALRIVFLKSMGLERSKTYTCLVSTTPTVIDGVNYYSLLTSSIK